MSNGFSGQYDKSANTINFNVLMFIINDSIVNSLPVGIKYNKFMLFLPPNSINETIHVNIHLLNYFNPKLVNEPKFYVILVITFCLAFTIFIFWL